ncbi:hypothetical protein ACVIW2_004122 [Bradyrhizobium huanghuaihaiense]|uniref:Uncharacterized protein n=1 Tax=Bradyrhizobium japonicum TaxID=375 RepID=A0ABV2S685_BRAJP|nr:MULTISPECIES: hypothetical protein [Bradyrhizobium]MBP1059102.1 hypothetical protein [Bradyrhizobium japonicum]MBP1090138.1 hypothetical protein [Bradyrhizobium japonicum]MBR1367577.1 hypothetical protein [Bradyrhizobium ottawaense]MCD9111749.1 hypothetical protein [Bradyrhizobium japonicum]MCD9257804.1 hypothetical protein [Bradyrhizobium japonicum SEMIA 5079]
MAKFSNWRGVDLRATQTSELGSSRLGAWQSRSSNAGGTIANHTAQWRQTHFRPQASGIEAFNSSAKYPVRDMDAQAAADTPNRNIENMQRSESRQE